MTRNTKVARRIVVPLLLALLAMLYLLINGYLTEYTVFSLLFYYGLFIIGLDSLKRAINEKEVNTNVFIFSQGLLFGSLFVLLSLSIKEITPYLEAINYFEMGSYSLIITSFLFSFLKGENENYYPKRICLLTLVSTLIFFNVGLLLAILKITGLELIWFKYIQNTGFFLGATNLVFSAVLLFDYFVKYKWRE